MDTWIFFTPLLIAMAIVLVLREFWTWYLKINQQVDGLQAIQAGQAEALKELKLINRNLTRWITEQDLKEDPVTDRLRDVILDTYETKVKKEEPKPEEVRPESKEVTNPLQGEFRPMDPEAKALAEVRFKENRCVYCGSLRSMNSAFCSEEHEKNYKQGGHADILPDND